MSFDPKEWAATAATCKWRVNTMMHAHPTFPCSKYCYQFEVWNSLDKEYGRCMHADRPADNELTGRRMDHAWVIANDRKILERDRRVNLILAEIARK